jgi:hypothetical protein
MADRVVVAAGAAVIVESMPSPTATVGTLHLVSDTGVSFPMAGPDALALLGYTTEDAIRLPSSLIMRMPVGPVLDPEAARRPVLGSGKAPGVA